MSAKISYDVVIAGGGHNGLVAACYLSMAGLRVLVLEKNDHIGGATHSHAVFKGIDARLSVYSYLVSLFPEKILTDLGIAFHTKRRAIATYMPSHGDEAFGLLVSNVAQEATRQSFRAWTGDDREFERYRLLQKKLSVFAEKVWPTLLSPLLSRKDMARRFVTKDEQEMWRALVEQPLGLFIEDHLSDDAVRGAVFTDAKIGVHTHPEDPTLLQNRTFLYHVIGQGTGEWRVPVGGMGALVDALSAKTQEHGAVLQTSCEVMAVAEEGDGFTVSYQEHGQEKNLHVQYVLFNASPDVVNRCMPGACSLDILPGSVFKINMVLERLPLLKDMNVAPHDAFAGTFRLNEGYEEMKQSYRNSARVIASEHIPGEMYCHTLTDPSILSSALQAKGYQTLTLFGLDVPYTWFHHDNNQTLKGDITQRFLRAINSVTRERIEDCLALDEDGNPCLDAKSPLDLEREVGLPQGNIFHGNLSWPFAETAEEVGAWGVETNFERVYICGSGAKRGGAVSGIPGHNAAMKVLEEIKRR